MNPYSVQGNQAQYNDAIMAQQRNAARNRGLRNSNSNSSNDEDDDDDDETGSKDDYGDPVVVVNDENLDSVVALKRKRASKTDDEFTIAMNQAGAQLQQQQQQYNAYIQGIGGPLQQQQTNNISALINAANYTQQQQPSQQSGSKVIMGPSSEITVSINPPVHTQEFPKSVDRIGVGNADVVEKAMLVKWDESVGKRPPRDMKRLNKGTWYVVCRISMWGSTPSLYLRSWKDYSDFGFFKPPTPYFSHPFQVGDQIALVATGYSDSRNKIAQEIAIITPTGILTVHPAIPAGAPVPIKSHTPERKAKKRAKKSKDDDDDDDDDDSEEYTGKSSKSKSKESGKKTAATPKSSTAATSAKKEGEPKDTKKKSAKKQPGRNPNISTSATQEIVYDLKHQKPNSPLIQNPYNNPSIPTQMGLSSNNQGYIDNSMYGASSPGYNPGYPYPGFGSFTFHNSQSPEQQSQIQGRRNSREAYPPFTIKNSLSNLVRIGSKEQLFPGSLPNTADLTGGSNASGQNGFTGMFPSPRMNPNQAQNDRYMSNPAAFSSLYLPNQPGDYPGMNSMSFNFGNGSAALMNENSIGGSTGNNNASMMGNNNGNNNNNSTNELGHQNSLYPTYSWMGSMNMQQPLQSYPSGLMPTNSFFGNPPNSNQGMSSNQQQQQQPPQRMLSFPQINPYP